MTDSSRRWAFLVGEGTLTANEVLEWADELSPERVRMPTSVPGDRALMVALANVDPDREAGGR